MKPVVKVFKFGGSSLKDAAAIQNVANILQNHKGKRLVIVVSAMGKTTNALEKVVEAHAAKTGQAFSILNDIKAQHYRLIDELFGKDDEVYAAVNDAFVEVEWILEEEPHENYDYMYDQIVSVGELVSSKIVTAYLNKVGLPVQWLDARDIILTDDIFREGWVQWEETLERSAKIARPMLDKGEFILTQGFIGSTSENFTTTLGREGSDYTAAILAYCLNAESVTIWKDVPGVLNADPRNFEEARLLEQISYREAIELAFYGASVIHPKTLQPLQRKEIPLHVKSFLNPMDMGTTVGKGIGIVPKVPCFIVKKNQVLLKLSSLDFSFIVEDNISEIFKLLHDHRLKVDLIQNSAISFSVCLDNKFKGLPALLEELKRKFKVVCHEDVSLYTIRHFDDQAVKSLQNGKSVLVEQRGKETVQLVVQ